MATYVENALEIISDNYMYYLNKEYKSFLINIKLYEMNSSLGEILFSSHKDEIFIDFGDNASNITYSEFFELLGDYESEDSPYLLTSENALKNIVSILEDYLKEILTYLFNKYPEHVFTKKGQVGLNQLLEYESIEDLKDRVITDKVVSISYKSIPDIIKYIEKEFNLDFKFHQAIYDGLTEVSGTRNLLVHNKGIINEVFLEKVGKREQYFSEDTYMLGKKIIISPESINDTVEVFVTLGKRIKNCLLEKFSKDVLGET